MRDQGLDLREYLNVALRRWWLLILGPLLAAAVVLSMEALDSNSPPPPPMYQATITLLAEGNRRVESYDELVMTRAVLARSIEANDLPLSVENLRSMVVPVSDPKSRFFRITVINANDALAERTADAVAKSMIEWVDIQRSSQLTLLEQDLARRGEFLKSLDSPEAAQELTRALTANLNSQLVIIDPAEVTQLAVSSTGPNTLRNLALAIFLGGAISVGSVVAVEYFQNPLRSPQQMGQRFGLNHLGSIPRWRGARAKTAQLAQSGSSDPLLIEAMNLTATNLEFGATSQNARTLLITSPDSGEGRSTLTAHIGVALASGWQEVILIDADLRRPALHQFFNLDNRRGLSTFLSDPGAEIDQVLQPTDFPRLKVVTAGPAPANPVELLKSPKMNRVLQELKDAGALVLVDAPPVAIASDGLILASLVDGVVIVADGQHGRMGAMELALGNLQNVNAAILGFVWNRVSLRPFPRSSRGRRYYQSGASRQSAAVEQPAAAAETGSEEDQSSEYPAVHRG
ncbi:MAG: polysaccharide biosynthesis tyrosine autokinase [Dehalococcoidia bacterium]